MATPPVRSDYKTFYPISTRWMDNDVYGHVNNVTYYSYFDTAANRYLMEEGYLDIQSAPVIGFVVSSACDYFSPIAHPDELQVGIRVDKLGNRSVTYGIAIFRQGEEKASAAGHFVHVFVDRASNTATKIPSSIRQALEKIQT
ncbi:MAG: thioesterase family protein [Pseudomonadales bacterium]